MGGGARLTPSCPPPAKVLGDPLQEAGEAGSLPPRSGGRPGPDGGELASWTVVTERAVGLKRKFNQEGGSGPAANAVA